MREVIKAMADSGIRTVDYATGYSRRLESAVRQNILWGVKQCNQNTADMIGEDFGRDGYEISYHSHPRPSHADMGGKQYAIGPARTINGKHYPSFEKEAEPLLNDYGCLHFKFSILLGISRSAYSDEQLAQFKAEDNRKFEFEGKEYTRYEASQLQKRIESEVRRQKDRANIAKAAGDDVMRREAQYRINLLTSKYAKLSKESGLPAKMERLKSAVKPLTNGNNGGIMKMSNVNKSVIPYTPGNTISQENLEKFATSIEQLGFKLSDISPYGGFETYRGNPEILNYLVEDLTIIKNEILLKTKVGKIGLRYEDLKNTDDFARATKNTIIFNKRVYDDSEFLEKMYQEAVDAHYFVGGTTYRNIPYHEIGHIVFGKMSKELKSTLENISKEAANEGLSVDDYIKKQISTYAKKDTFYYSELMPELTSGAYSTDKDIRDLCIKLIRGE